MNDLLVERFFSVSVELSDGRSTQLKVRGDSPAEVFKDVRARSDVRRVGKVTEIGEDAFHSDRPLPTVTPVRASGPAPAAVKSASVKSVSNEPSAEPSFDPRTPREAIIGFTISGPRVVRSSRPLGYEQPFKNLKAPAGAVAEPLPPEPARPVFSPFGPVKGPVANDPSRPSVFARPAPALIEPAPAPAPIAEETVSAPTTREYRIVKSRRQTGEPYLLQRGNWMQIKGKRVFEVEWEKGFESREKAEKQQAWLEQMAKEAAELNS